MQILGITDQLRESWMKQIARNLTDPVDGFLRNMRYSIMDRDPLFTSCFRNMLKGLRYETGAITRTKSDSECFRRTLRPVNQVRVFE